MHYHAWLIFVFLIETMLARLVSNSQSLVIHPPRPPEAELHYVSQAGLKHLGSSDPPVSAFQSAGIT
ncbi:hypothetical protein AAY473_003346, partial [Plecturocebus cupreus]